MIRTAITDDTELQRKPRMAGETNFGRFRFRNSLSFESGSYEQSYEPKDETLLKIKCYEYLGDNMVWVRSLGHGATARSN